MSSSTHLLPGIVLGVAILVVAGLAFAGVVWQRRRNAAEPGDSRPGQIRSFVCLLACVLLLAVSLTLHLFATRTGTVHAHDLFVVRADPVKGVPFYLAEFGEELAKGDALLRFDRPGSVAELRAMESELQLARSARDRILASKLDIDPRLTRAKARIEADDRVLVQRREAARSALRYIETQIRIEILGHQARVHDVSTTIERLRGRLDGNRCALEYAEAVANSGADLERHQLVSPLDARKRSRNVGTLTSEAAQLRRELARQEQLQHELVRGVAGLESRLNDHPVQLRQELRAIDAELVRLDECSDLVDCEIRADLARLDKLQAAELHEQELRARTIGLRIEQKVQELQVTAPFGGRILYRNSAPAATESHEPILALGSEHSICARVRLTRTEGEFLAEAGPVELHAAVDIDEPSFEAAFSSMRDVRSEPGVALVELKCQPSESVMHELLRGGRLEVELNWAPPIYHDPWFGLALIFLVGHVYWQTRSRRSKRSCTPPPVSVETRPASRGSFVA